MTRVTAADAMDVAKDAKAGLESHEAICAERYARIFDTLGELKTLAKWAAGAVASMAIGLIAWLLVQVYSMQTARVAALEKPAAVRAP